MSPRSARILQSICPGEPVVLAGPFAGMRYLSFASRSGILPKIVGSYEMELHGALREAIARRPARLINIGAGEGYYAVGVARALPSIEVHAFDSDVVARDRLRSLARLNGVEQRVSIHSACSPPLLASALVEGALVICDCGGCELELLDPQRVPGLRHADIIVELHPEKVPVIAEEFVSRFSASHEIQRFAMLDRGDAFPEVLGTLDRDERAFAVFERTERTEWAWARRRPPLEPTDGQ